MSVKLSFLWILYNSCSDRNVLSFRNMYKTSIVLNMEFRFNSNLLITWVHSLLLLILIPEALSCNFSLPNPHNPPWINIPHNHNTTQRLSLVTINPIHPIRWALSSRLHILKMLRILKMRTIHKSKLSTFKRYKSYQVIESTDRLHEVHVILRSFS